MRSPIPAEPGAIERWLIQSNKGVGWERHHSFLSTNEETEGISLPTVESGADHRTSAYGAFTGQSVSSFAPHA